MGVKKVVILKETLKKHGSKKDNYDSKICAKHSQK